MVVARRISVRKLSRSGLALVVAAMDVVGVTAGGLGVHVTLPRADRVAHPSDVRGFAEGGATANAKPQAAGPRAVRPAAAAAADSVIASRARSPS